MTLACGILFAALSVQPSSEPRASVDAGSVRWGARAAEHLLNRAGFGGTGADVQRTVALGLEGAVAALFPDPLRAPPPRILSEESVHGGLEHPHARHESLLARREGYTSHQPDLIVPLNKYGDWWVERMRAADDPLRDHMTIFWHGHFATSVKEVGSSQEMIAQIRFLREHALGPFEALVRGIGKTPAMLEYLDNAENVKAHPNENWARELMELFALGDGNYTEKDIKESARAFTGWSDAEGRFVYKRLDHDFGQKTFLSTTGQLDGDACVDVILEQPACARFLAGKIIGYFEGLPPAPERVEDYARFLREERYDIGALLRRLFLDPAFYREEILGARVQGPVEYLIGACRRLELAAPGQLVQNGADILGQRLFWPPSVKGWEGGLSWITTATLMNRSNVAGALLGLVDMRSLVVDDEFEPRGGEMAMSGEAAAPKPNAADRQSRSGAVNHVRVIQESGWKPALDLIARTRAAGARSDREIAGYWLGELLAVPVEPPMIDAPRAWLARERERLPAAEGALLEAEDAENLLRELAHLILSLPEAQLH